jgi:hypothetical protein
MCTFLFLLSLPIAQLHQHQLGLDESGSEIPCGCWKGPSIPMLSSSTWQHRAGSGSFSIYYISHYLKLQTGKRDEHDPNDKQGGKLIVP